MKKTIIPFVAYFLLSFSAFAQMPVPEEEQEVPVDKLVLKSNDVPQDVKQSVQKSFMDGTVIKWYSFPYTLKQYGWAYKNEINNNSMDTRPNMYAVHIKTSDGSWVDAVFSKDGKLIRSKEVIKNSELPAPIINAIEKSKYHDWGITDDRVVIKDNKNKTICYSVQVQKDNKKHNLYFDANGMQLKNNA